MAAFGALGDRQHAGSSIRGGFRRHVPVPALGLLLGLIAAFPSSAAEVAPGDAAIRNEVASVERAIDARFRDLSAEQPMALLGSARGVYLKGYGAVFTVEVNLAAAANLSPFRQSYSEEEKRQLNIRKRQRLETLEEQALAILVEESKKLTLVPSEEVVALAVSLFHFPWEDLTGLPRQMVASAAKSVLAATPTAEIRRRVGIGYF